MRYLFQLTKVIMFMLLVMSFFVQANSSIHPLVTSKATTKGAIMKTITIKVIELKDSSGLTYLGGLVSVAELQPYLAQLEVLLAEKFSPYRENQSKRDHGLFHLTLITPNEYQFIDKSAINLGQQLTVTLKGLGQVSSDNKKSYFVVAQSSDAQFFRQKRILSAKDFHVTLGFNPSDVYDKKKDITTLVTSF